MVQCFSAVFKSAAFRQKRYQLLILVALTTIVSSFVWIPSAVAAPAEPQIQQTAGKDDQDLQGLLAEAAQLADDTKRAEAIVLYKKALELAVVQQDLGNQQFILKQLGNLTQAEGEYAASIEHFETLLPLQQKAGDADGEAQSLASIGANYAALEEYDKAFGYYDDAVEIALKVENHWFAMAVLNAAGDLHITLKDADAARASYNQALDLATTLEDPTQIATLRKRLGNLEQAQGEYAASTAHFEALLALQQEAKDADGEAQTLASIGANFAGLEQYEKAFSYYDDAIEIAQDAENNWFVMAVLNAAGDLHLQLKDADAARASYEQALDLATTLEDPTQIATLRKRLGNLEQVQGEYAASTAHFEALLALQQEAKDADGEAQTLASIGANYAGLEQYEKAFGYYDDAIEIAQGAENNWFAMAVLNAAGDLHLQLKDADAARASYEQALDLATTLEDPTQIATLRKQLGNLEQTQGNYAASTAHFEALLALQQEAKDADGEAQTLASIGANYAGLKQAEKAFGYYDDAAQVALDAKNNWFAMAVLNAAADLHLERKEVAPARASLEQALALANTLDDPTQVVTLRKRLGNLEQTQGNYAASTAHFEALLPLQQEAKDADGEAQTLASIGANYAGLKAYEKAFSYYDDAVKIALDAKNNWFAMAVLNAAGDLHLELKEPAAARLSYEQALDLANTLFDKTQMVTLRKRLGNLEQTQGNYAASTAHFEALLALQQEAKDADAEAQTIASIGANYAGLEQYDKAFSYYDDAIRVARSAGNDGLVIAILNAAGDQQQQLKEYDAALGNFQNALPLVQKQNDREQEAQLYERIAGVYRNLGQTDKLISAYQSAAAVWQQIGELERASRAVATIGATYAALQDPSAFDYYDQSLQIAEQADAKALAAAIIKAKADLQRDLKQEDSAIATYQSALDAAKGAADTTLQAEIWESLGTVYLNKGHYEPAIEDYLQAFDLWGTLGDESHELSTRFRLWQLYSVTNQYDKAKALITWDIGFHAPDDGATVSGTISVQGLAMHPQFTKWQLDLLLNGDENNSTYIAFAPWPLWGDLATLDTTKYPNGKHKLRLRIVRQGANYDEYFLTININNP